MSSDTGNACTVRTEHRKSRHRRKFGDPGESQGSKSWRCGSNRWAPAANRITSRFQIVMPEKIHEALIVGGRHAEQLDHAPVVARLVEAFPDHVLHLRTIQVAIHERLVDDFPERFAA